jgi:hypothetical protein
VLQTPVLKMIMPERPKNLQELAEEERARLHKQKSLKSETHSLSCPNSFAHCGAQGHTPQTAWSTAKSCVRDTKRCTRILPMPATSAICFVRLPIRALSANTASARDGAA